MSSEGEKQQPEVVGKTEYPTTTGHGAETHQVATDVDSRLTTQLGCPISDNQNSLTYGTRGPTLLEDFILRDKIQHFDHEPIPERVVHARGVGAHGFFETYESLAEVTRADLFQRAGEKTPVFVRFSTVIGNRGSMDLARDVRGFAVKFYTKEGNWDLVGNNIPVFFVQDAMKFPDLVHAAKQEPDRAFPQAQSAHDNFWDFISLMPEATHMVMWTMSDRAIPRSYRFMEGFGVHTFRFVNEKGKSTFVKFIWKPKLGLQSVMWNEAMKINGADPDFHRRDLWESLTGPESPSQPQEATHTNKKKPAKLPLPEWELHCQMFDEDTAAKLPFDILDSTKLIPEEMIKTIVVGRLVLDRPVDNHFQETEQVAFCTNNIVPGIDFTNDPLLQGRSFSYPDVQLTRLGGPNHMHIPINMPRGCPVLNFHQDGFMSMGNPKGRVNYEPNSWSASDKKSVKDGELSHNEAARECPVTGFKSYQETGSIGARGTVDKSRVRPELFADHYSQARLFYYSQTTVEQRHIADAYTFELGKVRNPEIRKRMIANLRNVDEPLAATIAKNLGIAPADLPPASKMAKEPVIMKPSDPLSILKMAAKTNTFSGRKLGVLVTNGTDATQLKGIRSMIEGLGALVALIGPQGMVTLSDGEVVPVDECLPGGPSILFDAVVLLVGPQGVTELHSMPQPTADFIWDAYYHCKFIAYNSHASALFAQIGFTSKLDAGCFNLTDEDTLKSFVNKLGEQRFWDREDAIRAPQVPGGP